MKQNPGILVAGVLILAAVAFIIIGHSALAPSASTPGSGNAPAAQASQAPTPNPPALTTDVSSAPTPELPVPQSPALHWTPVVPREKPAAAGGVARAGANNAEPSTEPVIDEPFARAALELVGVDANAEQVWTTAINDPNLPPESRQNLIEDLNETGFPDPRHLTQADLPLIVNRLWTIEQLAPTAMDDVNSAAFDEAYKDLLDMYAKVQP